MAKYAAAEAAVARVDQAVQTLGGNGFAQRVRPRRAARRRPRRPGRAGEPGDDPQLRRPVQPGPAEVVLGAPMSELVHYAVDRAIATVTLDSPDEPQRAVRAAGRRARPRTCARPQPTTRVRAVVLTHTGTTFCAGADLASSPPRAGRRRARAACSSCCARSSSCRSRWWRAIDGHVRAGGLGLVGACDIAVAEPGRDVRVHRGAARARAGDHLADHARPDDRPRGEPLLPHRRDVRRGGGRRAAG